MKLYSRFLTASALLAIAGLAATSCSNKEEDIFDDAAAVRMDAAKTETKALLISAPNGWELSYFADNEWEPGYVILMKFHNDESVEMAGSNAWVANAFMSQDRYAVQHETSLYKMISDDGPVLTFDTFNRMLHIFSEPYNLPSPTYNPENVPFPIGPQEKNAVSGKDYDVNESGYGHNGDYEFVVLSKSENEIILRGKKTRITMRMRRLADDTDWDTYFATVHRLAENTFSTRFGDLKMVVGGHELHLSNLTSGVMSILADDDDPVMETVKVPFLYTPDGIRLREPYKGFDDRLADIAIQNFAFNPDGTLRCTDRDVEFALNSSFAEIFITRTFSWDINTDNAGGKAKEILEKLTAEFAANTSYNGIRNLYFTYDPINRRYGLLTRGNKGSNGTLFGDYTIAEDKTLKMTYTGTEGDRNGLTRVQQIASLAELLQYLSSVNWTVTTDSPMAPERLTFIDAANSDDFFMVSMR